MLSNKNVWILMCGEFISNMGLWLGTIGNLEFLQNLVPSDLHKSLILLIGMFAGLMFGPLAGRIVDTMSKKKVMLYSSLLRIVAVWFMFVAIWNESIAWMCVYMVLIGIAAAFYQPALQASLPLIVEPYQLMSINGLHMNVGTVARILGTAMAGVLLLFLSLFQVYFLSMLSYVFILVGTFFLTYEDKMKEKKEKAKEGFKEIWPLLGSTPPVLMGLILMLVPTLFLGSFNLMVLKISEIQGDPAIKSWLYTAEGIGFMLGAFFARKITGNRNPIHVMLTAASVIAVAHLSLYFADMKIPSIISFAVFGLSAGAFFPISATLFQTMVKRELHGRFFSFRGMVDRILFQVILVSAGLFLDTIGFNNMVLVYGAISSIIVIVFVIMLRRGTLIHGKSSTQKQSQGIH
ncbi:MAG: MFS transporter [Bacillus sp. (in: firmicutes)]